MGSKKETRLRRARRGRSKIRELGVPRLCVFRTPQHVYAQVILAGDGSDKVIASASTVGASFEQSTTGNAKSAALVGAAIADKAKAAGVTKVAFDRSGFKYHGRIKALAEAAREGGLEF